MSGESQFSGRTVLVTGAARGVLPVDGGLSM